MNSIVLFGTTINTAVVFQLQSTLILLLMYAGVALLLMNKANRKLHVKIMSSAMIWDVLLILQIELNRGAINKASKAIENPMMLNIHVLLAVSSVVCYIIMALTGRQILKGNLNKVSKHQLMGRITILLRTLTYATSYFAS